MSKSPQGQQRAWMFYISLVLCTVIATLGILFPKWVAGGASAFTNTTIRALDWFYLLATSGSLVFCIGLALSRYGSVRLGRPGEKAEFSTLSWLSMLFAAGMGTGLLFWGIAEPLTHFSGMPGVTPNTPQAARRALVVTGLHWGFHAWAIYALAGLVLAYYGFCKKKPYLPGEPIRSSFKTRWAGPVGLAADFIAVIAVAFGVAGSLAIGVLQLEAGLSVSAGTPAESTWIQVGILGVIFICYTVSASTGLNKGIKWLSIINMVVATLLVVFVLIAGPTSYLLRTFINFLGDYISSLPSLAFNLYPFSSDRDWMKDWTIIYFVWWIAWAPFVGVFIARISRGRTIREFVVGVLLAPTLFSVLWFAVFGGVGFYEELQGAGGIASLVREDITVALFAVFKRFPLSNLLNIIALGLVFIFLITSVDSATFVLGMLTMGGTLNPPASRKLAWGVALGVIGGALMISRNIEVVRAMAVVGAIPFTFILLLQGTALLRALQADHSQTPPEE